MGCGCSSSSNNVDKNAKQHMPQDSTPNQNENQGQAQQPAGPQQGQAQQDQPSNNVSPEKGKNEPQEVRNSPSFHQQGSVQISPAKHTIEYERKKQTDQQKRAIEGVNKDDIYTFYDLSDEKFPFSQSLEDEKFPSYTILHFIAHFDRGELANEFFELIRDDAIYDGLDPEEQVKKLLNIQDRKGRTPFMVAALQNKPFTLKAMIDTELCNYTLRDYQKFNIEDLAARHCPNGYAHIQKLKNLSLMKSRGDSKLVERLKKLEAGLKRNTHEKEKNEREKQRLQEELIEAQNYQDNTQIYNIQRQIQQIDIENDELENELQGLYNEETELKILQGKIGEIKKQINLIDQEKKRKKEYLNKIKDLQKQIHKKFGGVKNMAGILQGMAKGTDMTDPADIKIEVEGTDEQRKNLQDQIKQLEEEGLLHDKFNPKLLIAEKQALISLMAEEGSNNNNLLDANDIEDPNAIPKNSKVYGILQRYEGSNQAFIDNEFPHTYKTLNFDGKSESGNHKNVKWLRPHAFLNADYSEIQVFDNIHPNDIKQGALGVCYYLCALSALCEFPSRVPKCFITKETNKVGAYSVVFFRQGKPTEVVIDDHFPCYDWGKPLFAKPEGKELWCLIMEKAFCKMCGSYTIAEAGRSYEAFEVLTGCPGEYINLKDFTPDEIWDKSVEYDAQNFLIACGSVSGTNDQDVNGIVCGHAYTLIGAISYNGVRLLKIRNPWGQGEWKGDYSDQSSKWTDELRDAIGWVDRDDGVFYMTPEDFKDHFRSIHLGMYHEDYFYSYAEAETEPMEVAAFRFFLASDADVYFRAHQLDERYRQQYGESGYSWLDFEIYKVNSDDKLETVFPGTEIPYWRDEMSVFLNKTNKRIHLAEGEYVLFTRANWKNGKRNELVVSAYGNQKVNMERMHVEQKEIMRDRFEAMARSMTKKGGYSTFSYYSGYFNNDYFVFWLKNEKTSGSSEFTMNFKTHTNMKLLEYNKEDDDHVKVKLNAQETSFVILEKITKGEGTQLSWETTLTSYN